MLCLLIIDHGPAIGVTLLPRPVSILPRSSPCPAPMLCKLYSNSCTWRQMMYKTDKSYQVSLRKNFGFKSPIRKVLTSWSASIISKVLQSNLLLGTWILNLSKVVRCNRIPASIISALCSGRAVSHTALNDEIKILWRILMEVKIIYMCVAEKKYIT